MSSSRPAPAPFNPSWGVARARPKPARSAGSAALLAAPALLAALLLLPWSPLWAGLGLLLGAAATGVWVGAQGWLGLRSCGAQALEARSHPRLANVLAGLAGGLGLAHVTAATVPTPEARAWLFPFGGRAVLVCTEGLLESFTRTEVEAIVASLLVRRRDHKAMRPLIAAALGPLSADLAAVTEADDIRALSLTRYPPALASALRRATPERGRAAAFSFAPVGPPSPEQRAAEILDL